MVRLAAGATMLGSAMDLTINTGQTPAWHYTGDQTGYGEMAKRMAAGMAPAKGYATTDRRGPLVTGVTRSGDTIVTMFAANGTTGLTFAAANSAISPTNFAFGTNSSFGAAMTLTAFSIDSATQCTCTFGSAVPSGAAVRVTQAMNPDYANFLKGTYADGGAMTRPLFVPLVAA